MTDLEIDGLHFQWIESKAQISCAVITQLICTFALHKAIFLMILLIFGSNFIIVSCWKKVLFYYCDYGR